MLLNLYQSHVAILVPSVRKAAERLAHFPFQIGQEEIWDGEGTKEIYVEGEKANSLLLVEPIKPGPYQSALEKRGPGLHHLAIDVLNLETFIQSLSGSGWLLHPRSIETIKKARTAWLARPGFPALIEVHERKELVERPLFVERVFLGIKESDVRLLEVVGLSSIVGRSESATELILASQKINVAALVQ